MMKLRINPIVAEDLKNIKEYIAEDNEEMAVKTIQEIYARIENIQQFPYMRADLAKRVSFWTDYKYVICGNYVVLYKIGKEYVGVCRVVNRYQDIMDCQHFFRQIFLGYFSDIVQAFDTLRKNVCGDDYTSLHNPIVLSSVLPAYGMFHSIQILFL